MKTRIRDRFYEVSKGYDSFTNFSFSIEEWSAQPIYFAKEMIDTLNRLHLQNRKIKSIKAIGLGYNLQRDCIEDAAYRFLENMNLSEEEMQRLSDYENIDPETPINLWVETDEPVLIEFEDGDTLEILAWDEQTFYVAMNTLPKILKPGINPNNFDAGILFSKCLGKTVVDYELINKEVDPGFYREQLLESGRKVEAPDILKLLLDDGTHLAFSAFCDYFHITLEDENNILLKVPVKDVKPALTDWSALSTDPITGIRSASDTLYFQEEAVLKSSDRCLVLYTEQTESKAILKGHSSRLLTVAMKMAGPFIADNYRYEFHAQDWAAILSNMERLLSLDDYNEYTAILTQYSITDGESILPELEDITLKKEFFWEYKNSYESLLNDLRVWTAKVVSDSDKLYLEII